MRHGWLRFVVLAIALALPASALAHVERTAYWPDPRPDTSVKPAAGGAVPKARSLRSAVLGRGVGRVRVVCQSNSLKRVKHAIGAARSVGYRNRPTDKPKKFTKHQARSLLSDNKRLFKKCRYHEIQPAVTASHNNDRVVIMPGIYSEPESRKVPDLPPQCDKYRVESEKGAGAVSYAYQYYCPNAQNLVALIGRKLGPGQDPATSPTGRPDPHGIPNLGPCIRCNVQVEGSGVTPQDTIIDAGDTHSGNGAPIKAVKDVGFKVDRADGVVLRNFTVRHAAEHDVYVLETDGYYMNRMNYFYAGEYGALMFTSDHGLTDICDAVGNGDSGVYPGGAPDSAGADRDKSFYPVPRLNQTITHCDSHHNNLGYSGTMGNSTHVVNNNFYDNTTGIATDSFFAGGHPGFPQDSAVFERNRIYSNNFNVYGPDSDVTSRVPVPIGVGIFIAGGNTDTVAGNYIYDNWRRGTMLIAVPDAISCAPNPDEGAPPCVPQSYSSTSNGDQYHDNVMSRTPAGQPSPNGVDFWWDEFSGNRGDCWFNNKGIDGSTGSVTGDPSVPPQEGTSVPGFLPEDCGASSNVGLGSQRKESVLLACAGDLAEGSYDSSVCDWFSMPPKPAKPTNAPPGGPTPNVGASSLSFPRLCTLIGPANGGTLTCSPFQHRIS